MARYNRLNFEQKFKFGQWLITMQEGGRLKGRTMDDIAREYTGIIGVTVTAPVVASALKAAGIPVPRPRVMGDSVLAAQITALESRVDALEEMVFEVSK